MTLAQRIARWRVTLGFVLAAVVLWLATPTVTTMTIGAAIALLGESIRIWAAGHIEKSREVTRSGPYRFTRHPLYVGSSLIGVGIAIAGILYFVAGGQQLATSPAFQTEIANDAKQAAGKASDKLAPVVAWKLRMLRFIGLY